MQMQIYVCKQKLHEKPQVLTLSKVAGHFLLFRDPYQLQKKRTFKPRIQFSWEMKLDIVKLDAMSPRGLVRPNFLRAA